MLPLEHSAICDLHYLRQVLLYNQESIYIFAYKCLRRGVGKVYYPNVDCV